MQASVSSNSSRILDLDEIAGEAVGGKAEGLSQLRAMGLRVPAGFVILGATPESLPADLDDRYRALGAGPVAIRSSALDEDGAGASWAGQYETLLDVEGEEAVREAVTRCLQSLSSDRAAAYRDERERPEENEMCVVVQRMVDAKAAGVLFSVDPVSSRRAHVVIDAVEGLGEALVSGEATPDHYVLSRSGETLRFDLIADMPIIDDATRRDLVREALAAEDERGEPLDLEWAVDEAGVIWWLQARPITTLVADLNELDTPLQEPDHVFTRCNVGEMFPGACTPLSFSFTARGIDVGMQMMHKRIGIQKEIHPYLNTLGMFYGHLFINLTTMSDTATQALGSSAEQMCLSICGRRIDEPKIKAKAPPPLRERIPNGLRYVRYLFSQKSARAGLKSLLAGLRFQPASDSALDQWRAIDERFDAIFHAMDYHLISSAGAGALAPTLLGIISKGEDPTEAHHAQVAALLAGAKNVESADIAAGAKRVLDQIVLQQDAVERFADVDDQAALAWLRDDNSGSASREFARYLARHGHRAIKELELRQKEWREDPLPLVSSLQASARARLQSRAEGKPSRAVEEGPHDPTAASSLPIRWLAKLAHQTVRSREETKSGLVAVTVRFKEGYRELARRMAAEESIADEDLVFFLTHDELGYLLRGEAPGLSKLASERRDIFPRQASLSFPEVFAGEPEPVDLDRLADPGSKSVKGAPVSRGVVAGVARVVSSPEEAEALREGEILIAPITDVGWTPYFSMIAGLVTDVGSAVSHGAVVAREFGLPAVVNTLVATRVFETGDCIVLDGDRGVVRLQGPEDEPSG